MKTTPRKAEKFDREFLKGQNDIFDKVDNFKVQ